ncbi:MAG: hypothetical protein QOF11_1640 [Chloroflexota bacterium]|nr:hypothetical protein [Chloroflexota bacterium]
MTDDFDADFGDLDLEPMVDPAAPEPTPWDGRITPDAWRDHFPASSSDIPGARSSQPVTPILTDAVANASDAVQLARDFDLATLGAALSERNTGTKDASQWTKADRVIYSAAMIRAEFDRAEAAKAEIPEAIDEPDAIRDMSDDDFEQLVQVAKGTHDGGRRLSPAGREVARRLSGFAR